MRWTPVCPYPRLEPERGVAALVDGAQVALFRTHDGTVYAIGNLDPVSGAAPGSSSLPRCGSCRSPTTVNCAPPHCPVWTIHPTS